MDELYDQTLENMETTHRTLAARVPEPKAVVFGEGYVYRYEERNIHQAIVQKLARVVSGLHASRLLLANGFLQELGALQRMLDDFNEDILFLAYSVISGESSDSHQKYLDSFFEEEFDNQESAIMSTQKREMVPRQKIRAYIARIEVTGLNPSDRTEVMRTVQKVYSGFVHGASPHIMEMYNGDPPQFKLRGMAGTPLADEHRDDLWNYFYRSITSFAISAKAFGDDTLCQSILKYMKSLAAANGMDFSNPPKPTKAQR